MIEPRTDIEINMNFEPCEFDRLTDMGIELGLNNHSNSDKELAVRTIRMALNVLYEDIHGKRCSIF